MVAIRLVRAREGARWSGGYVALSDVVIHMSRLGEAQVITFRISKPLVLPYGDFPVRRDLLAQGSITHL